MHNKKGMAVAKLLVTPGFWVVVGIFAIFYFGLFSTGCIVCSNEYQYEINFSSGNINMISRSTQPFGVIQQEPGTQNEVRWSNVVSPLDVQVSASTTGLNYISFPEIRTYILTQNLALNTANMQSVSMRLDASGSLNARSGSGVRSSVWLVSGNDMVLVYESPLPIQSVGEESSFERHGTLSIDRVPGGFTSTFGTQTREIDLDNNKTYEILIHTGIRGQGQNNHGDGGSASGTVKVSNIVYTQQSAAGSGGTGGNSSGPGYSPGSGSVSFITQFTNGVSSFWDSIVNFFRGLF